MMVTGEGNRLKTWMSRDDLISNRRMQCCDEEEEECDDGEEEEEEEEDDDVNGEDERCGCDGVMVTASNRIVGNL